MRLFKIIATTLTFAITPSVLCASNSEVTSVSVQFQPDNRQVQYDAQILAFTENGILNSTASVQLVLNGILPHETPNEFFSNNQNTVFIFCSKVATKQFNYSALWKAQAATYCIDLDFAGTAIRLLADNNCANFALARTCSVLSIEDNIITLQVYDQLFKNAYISKFKAEACGTISYVSNSFQKCKRASP